MWYDIIGVAAHCANPEATAKEWSNQHLPYSEEATLQKLEQWKQSTTGPTTCAKFATYRPKGCNGCKFKDKIRSPARLGVQYKEVATPQKALDTIGSAILIPNLLSEHLRVLK